MSTEISTRRPEKTDLVVTRIVDAPVEEVWRAWTDPDLVRRWWGPKDYTAPVARIDLREGGRYIFGMRAPEAHGGHTHYTAGVYTMVVPLQRLEFTQRLVDADGNPIDPARAGLPPDFPAEIRTAVAFRRMRGNMTELTVTEYDWSAGQMYVYSLAGLHQSIDKLADHLR